MRNARSSALAIVAAALLALSGCAAAPSDGGSTSDGDRISVVAVTDAYGSIVEAIGGDVVDVTSIVSGPTQDPHEYEATARDQLAVSRAQLVIVNGGGYDDFMMRLLESSDAVVVDASQASGLMPEGPAEESVSADVTHDDHAHEGHAHGTGFNEHVWYSTHGVEHIAEAITAELLELAPAGREQIEAGSSAFLTELDALHDRAHTLEHELGGGDVIATEPVAGYLLEDLGFHDVTPAAFVSAIEAGTGIGARILDEVLGSLEREEIRLVAVNAQSAGPEAELVREAAAAAGVPVVEFSETLPEGVDFLGWISATLDAVEDALR